MTDTATTRPGRIRPRDRDAILQSLAAGVVPRRGQQHIQVGRAPEVAALLRDVGRIGEGGTAVRFVIGEYGAGKTFFLQLVRAAALEKGLVTLHADLTPDRRLHGTGGQARTLYAELLRNLATRTSPEGGGLAGVVERFITSALTQARELDADVGDIITARLDQLRDMTGGYDVATVVAAYWRGHDTGNEQLTQDAVRWLRGEFTTKTEARTALGVRTIVDDANVYDMLKLLARFVSLAGYSGLLVVLDEMVNLYKLAHTKARNANFEQVLRIVNDCLQGGVEHLGFVMGGTPEFLLDTRRGLYSYEALASRLAENPFAVDGLADLSGPVIRLANLTPEELYVLLQRLRHVQALGDPDRHLLPDEALTAFMQHCAQRIGEAYFRTPRTTVKAFVQLLAILEQHPDTDWRGLLGQVDIGPDQNPDLAPLEDDPDAEGPDRAWRLPADDEAGGGDDDLTTFRL